LAIYRSGFVGSASIGVYSLTTDKMAIVPKWVSPGKAERFTRMWKFKWDSASAFCSREGNRGSKIGF